MKRLLHSVVRTRIIPLIGALSLITGLLVGFAEPAAAAAPALKAQGTQLVTSGGQAVKLSGVNRSGTEYNCQQGGGIFSGPTDQASVDLLKSWNVNMVRIPLNEHCWLGIDWAQGSTGAPYQNAIADYVNLLNSNNIYVVLDLHFTGPSAQWGEQRKEMPNRANSLPFWKQVAAKFKNTSNVLYEPYNEPHDISANIWKNGGTTAEGWQAAGYQELVNAIRSSGATQPIIVNGLDWGHDMSVLLNAMPTDSANNLVAGQHLYNFKACVTEDCWNQKFKPIAQKYPLVAAEVGVNNCSAALPVRFMKWMDANGGDGYGFWNFGTGGCPDGDAFGGSALISDWNGGTTPYGQDIKDYFLDNGSNTPTEPTNPTDPGNPGTGTCGGNNYAAEYFNNTALSGRAAATGCDTLIDKNWGVGSPATGVNADQFSARWTRNFEVAGGVYKYTLAGDDGVRLFIDDKLVIDGWKNQGPTTYYAWKGLGAGKHVMRIEYYDNTGGAQVKLNWTKQSS